MFLDASNSITCLSRSWPANNFHYVTLSRPQIKVPDNTKHYDLRTQYTPYLPTVLSEILFSLHCCTIDGEPKFAGGNLSEKMMKKKILACLKFIQHKSSDILLQYQSTIITEPETQPPYLHHPSSLPYPELQKFSPHTHKLLLKYSTPIFSTTSSKFFL